VAERNVMDSKYLSFVEIKDTGKTKVWHVYSKSSGKVLARISWHGPWRQYCFMPMSMTIWNKGCLEDINKFITEQMDARKK
jgi:hypothetical protein